MSFFCHLDRRERWQDCGNFLERKSLSKTITNYLIFCHLDRRERSHSELAKDWWFSLWYFLCDLSLRSRWQDCGDFLECKSLSKTIANYLIFCHLDQRERSHSELAKDWWFSLRYFLCDLSLRSRWQYCGDIFLSSYLRRSLVPRDDKNAMTNFDKDAAR